MLTWKGIIGRNFRPQEFDAYVSTLTFSNWRPQFVVVHNTSEPRLSQWHSTPGAQRMRNLESYYRDTQRWSGGPHLFIADDFIWVFTPLTTPGVHSPSWNAISWGVEMVGEFEQEPFSPGVRENTVDALVTLHACAGLNPATLRFHKEDPKTTHKECPGKNVDKDDLISRIQERLAGKENGEHSAIYNFLGLNPPAAVPGGPANASNGNFPGQNPTIAAPGGPANAPNGNFLGLNPPIAAPGGPPNPCNAVPAVATGPA